MSHLDLGFGLTFVGLAKMVQDEKQFSSWDALSSRGLAKLSEPRALAGRAPYFV
jgi:hypothetical protein